jgi:hypothetical protein
MTKYCLQALALLLLQLNCNAFTISPASSIQRTTTTITQLHAEKQSRSSLLNPPSPKKNSIKPTIEPKPDEEQEEVFGAKFFGGSAIKEELYDEAVEEQAGKISALYPTKPKTEAPSEEDDSSSKGYKRYMDTDAFDEASRPIAQRLQAAINQALYISEDDADIISVDQIYSPNVQWKSPLSRAKNSKNPLDELTNALDFYKRVDVAILSAKTVGGSEGDKVQKIESRWEISVIWPNTWESRVLIGGTSALTVDKESGLILSQADKLDLGGKDGQDVFKAIYSQIQPRFWDLYHVGMTPSAEMMQKVTPSNVKKGAFSKYDVFEIPSRLVLQPSIADKGGRRDRGAESLPNHAFSSTILTRGPKTQRYVTTTPVEVAIRRSEDSKSIITWNVPLPAEFVSYYDEFPEGDAEGDVEGFDDDSKCQYSYQPRRLVATLPYGGSAQDKEVSDVRKELYEAITKDGLKPKLVDGRPEFFFLNYDVKACFTADGGLGMAVYEWRPASSKSNEVGIELEM